MGSEGHNLDIKKLTHRPEYRLRIGKHRILFKKDEDRSLILITVIRARGRAYKGAT